MEEDIKETIVVNKSGITAESEPEAQPEPEVQPELDTAPESEPETEPETEAQSEPEEEPETALETEQPTAGADTEESTQTDSMYDDIEYTLLLHEVSDLTIPIPGMKQPEPEDTEGSEEDSEEDQAEVEAAETPEEQTETGFGLPEGHREIGEISERIEARRIYNERKKRRMRTRFYVIMTVLVLGIFFLIISLSSIFTVDSIEVRGNKHYTAEEIINMGHAVPGRNIIYDLNDQEIEDYLEQNPYIKRAEVTRRLPSTMVIKVTERKEKIAFR